MSEQLIATPCAFGENGGFLLERELGLGGMGGVYMGRDKMLDRPVAVKVMLKEYGDDPEFVEKFRKEAQAAAKLVHPNIAQIYSFGICDGMPYIAMELVSGGSLYSIMQSTPGKADITRVMKIGQQVALALQCASDQGFVHGDVKPENVLLDANGNAKLVDFGLAAMQTNTDEIWGTPYYISPEKVRKEPVDFRADMYSLGGTLYHALTGVAPFEGDDPIAVVKKRFDGAPRKPSEIRSEITPAIDKLIMKMLSLDKNDRYPSFEALLEAFKNVLSTGLTKKLGDLNGGKRIILKTTRKIEDLEPVAPEDAETAKPDAEDEEGGNLGLKVALFIVGGILVVGGIIGGLLWFKSASAKAEREAVRMQIQSGIDKAGEAIADTVRKTAEFNDEFAKTAGDALAEVDKIDAALKEYLSGDELTAAMAELNKRAAAAKASISQVEATSKMIAEKAAESETLKGDVTQEGMQKLVDLSNSLVESYDQMRGAEAVVEVRKSIAFIRDSGKRMLENAKKTKMVEKMKAEREAKAMAALAAEKEKKEKAEQEKQAKIDEEIKSIDEKFDTLVKQGAIRQLDWDGAIRQLNNLSSEFTTAEGEIAAKLQVRKVKNLQKMQKVLVDNIVGYTFKKGPMKGAKVLKADYENLVITKDGGKNKQNLSWTKLLKDENYASLREVIGYYIFNGRKNAKLSKMEWADAMTGAALTMMLEESDANGAKRLLAEVIAQFPDYAKTIGEIFPDVALENNDAAGDE